MCLQSAELTDDEQYACHHDDCDERGEQSVLHWFDVSLGTVDQPTVNGRPHAAHDPPLKLSPLEHYRALYAI